MLNIHYKYKPAYGVSGNSVCCHNHAECVSTPCVQNIAFVCVCVNESGRYVCHSPVRGKETGYGYELDLYGSGFKSCGVLL